MFAGWKQPERTQRREEEINHALKLEAERHEAVIKNMHRLRALRLARDAKSKTSGRLPARTATSNEVMGIRVPRVAGYGAHNLVVL